MKYKVRITREYEIETESGMEDAIKGASDTTNWMYASNNRVVSMSAAVMEEKPAAEMERA